MKRRLATLTSIGLVATVVTACGGDSGSSSGSTAPPPAAGNLAWGTDEVLALALKPSDTASPLAVNSGALTLTDTSETADPVNVNPM
jgi:hypothetical protein